MVYVSHQMEYFFLTKNGIRSISVKWQEMDPDPPTRVVLEGQLDSDTRNTVLVMTPKNAEHQYSPNFTSGYL